MMDNPREHLMRADPELWWKLSPGERAAYNAGWSACALFTDTILFADRETPDIYTAAVRTLEQVRAAHT